MGSSYSKDNRFAVASAQKLKDVEKVGIDLIKKVSCSSVDKQIKDHAKFIYGQMERSLQELIFLLEQDSLEHVNVEEEVGRRLTVLDDALLLLSAISKKFPKKESLVDEIRSIFLAISRFKNAFVVDFLEKLREQDMAPEQKRTILGRVVQFFTGGDDEEDANSSQGALPSEADSGEASGRK